jgi:hypothetical protein
VLKSHHDSITIPIYQTNDLKWIGGMIPYPAIHLKQKYHREQAIRKDFSRSSKAKHISLGFMVAGK